MHRPNRSTGLLYISIDTSKILACPQPVYGDRVIAAVLGAGPVHQSSVEGWNRSAGGVAGGWKSTEEVDHDRPRLKAMERADREACAREIAQRPERVAE